MATIPPLKEFLIPQGWNALLNHEKKTALFIGLVTHTNCKANTRLELVTKATENELKSHITGLGYELLPVPEQKKR